MTRSRVLSSALGLATIGGLLVLPFAAPAAAETAAVSAAAPSRILFYSQRTSGGSLFSVPGDGGAITEVATDVPGDHKPDLSPSGARVAFTAYIGSTIEVFTASSTGGTARRMTEDNAAAADPAWSPDGAQIAYSRVVAGQRDISLRPMAGGVYRQLTNDSSPDYSPAWSPDGSRLAYVKRVAGTPRIHVVNADGTGDRQLGTATGQEQPDWSPDGSKIAFTSYTADGFGDVYVMAADGTGAVPLAASPGVYETEPSWSPDGTRIAYRSSASGFDDIWTMDAGGGSQVNLTNDADVDDQPSWGPPPPAPGTPAITVTPYQNLDPAGQTVVVQGSGFTPETTILLSQCGVHETVSCLQVTGAAAAPDGTFTTTMDVADRFGPTQYCTTAARCWVRANSFMSQPHDSADHPISFQGTPPPAAPTSTGLASSANPSTEGDDVTFTATVAPTGTGSGTPDGTVTFSLDGSAGTPVTLVGGQATWSTSTLTPGDHTVTATYSGSSSYQSSTSPPLTQTVEAVPPPPPSPPAITVTPNTGLNPYGQTVNVSGSDFPGGAQISVLQCTDPTPTSTVCDLLEYAGATSQGTFTQDVTPRLAMLNGRTCATNCRIRAYVGSTPPVFAEQGIAFAVVTPASTVTPSTGLHPYGHMITVSGSGFPAGAQLTVMQCTDVSSSSTACDQLAYPTVSNQGTFTQDVTVTLAMRLGRTCSTNCRIRVYLASTPPVMTEHPITFARAPRLGVTVAPNRGVSRAGATVQVGWSNFPANTMLVISQCSGTVCVSKQSVLSGSGSSSTPVSVAYAMGTGTCSSKCRVRVAIANTPTLFGEASLTFARA